MGKTALLSRLVQDYFTDPDLPSLTQAYRRYGFIPIMIPLREYTAV